MDPTQYVGTFSCLLKWFSEAQLLYPKISNNEEIRFLFYDSRKKNIIWNYDFELSEDEIHNMDKIVTVIYIHKQKIKVRLYHLKKELLER